MARESYATTKYSPNQPANTSFDSIFGSITPSKGYFFSKIGGKDHQVVLAVQPNGQMEVRTVEDIRLRILSAPRAERANLQRRLKSLGYNIKEVNGGTNPADKFEDVVVDAATKYTEQLIGQYTFAKSQGAKFTPFTFNDYLSSSAAGGGEGGTSRNINVASFSDNESRAILEDFYAQAVGRRPSDDEVKKFNAAINKASKARPTVTTTVTSGTGNSTTTSKQGFSQVDAQMMARQEAEAQVGSTGFRNSTVYYDAFLRAIGQQV